MDVTFSVFGVLVTALLINCSDVEIDPNGYILYCPCMGRFGNQADHFLGALAFAHGLNRTLALPPWVEYKSGQPKSIQVPFDTYFKVDALKAYHRVVTMEYFMLNIAPTLWPVGKRLVFCYSSRGEGSDCHAKEGNPFGPFWDTFNVDFDDSVFYYPLHYDVHHHNQVEKWNEKFPAEKYPVLAFTGAPASFPVQHQNRQLHEYLVWSDMILKKAKDFISSTLPKGPFVGIHLRNGVDWVRACNHIEHSPMLFAASQCLGYDNEYGGATPEMCFPSKDAVLKQLKRTVKAMKARAVFVASDNDHMISEINKFFSDMKVKAYKLPSSDPHTDLAILGLSNHFIGNCISSFTAFAKRERDVNNLISSFWAFPPKKTTSEINQFHDEL